MTRVAVIGNAGGGKSTMCRALSAAHDLPYYSIDDIQWRPGWVPAPAHEYTKQHDLLLAQDRWIIDGLGTTGSMTMRFSAAETIIFVDHPIWVHYWWAAKRQIKSIFVGRPDAPEGCPMLPVTVRLFRMMWHVHKRLRPTLLEALDQHRNTARIVHIRSPQQLNALTARDC